MMQSKMVLPSFVTWCGLALSVAWLLGAPWWIGLAGLLCDACDGRLARRLGAETGFGSLFDWSTDVVVMALALVKCGAGAWLVLLLPLQVSFRHASVRFCGRAALTLVLMAAEVLGLKAWP